MLTGKASRCYGDQPICPLVCVHISFSVQLAQLDTLRVEGECFDTPLLRTRDKLEEGRGQKLKLRSRLGKIEVFTQSVVLFYITSIYWSNDYTAQKECVDSVKSMY